MNWMRETKTKNMRLINQIALIFFQFRIVDMPFARQLNAVLSQYSISLKPLQHVLRGGGFYGFWMCIFYTKH